MLGRRDLLKTSGATALATMLPHTAAAASSDTSKMAPPPGPREIVPLNEGWRFHLGHASDPAKDFGFGRSHDTYAKSGDAGTPVAEAKFDASTWETVSLPHDWAVDLPFERFGPAGSDADKTGSFQGFKPLGRMWPASSVGWYRMVLPLPKGDAGRRLLLQFDGVSRDCRVILNGFFVGANESGYAPFELDITDFAKPGEDNVLVVRCDVSLGEAWSYEGAGLYRAVRLVKTAPVHVRQYGATVRSTVGADGATTQILTEIVNDGPATTAHVRSTVSDATGRAVASLLSAPVTLPEWATLTATQQTLIARPTLWSLETPHLYTLTTEILVGGVVVDNNQTHFGIRTLRFDPDKGFFLNGQPVKIKGTCNVGSTQLWKLTTISR